MASIIIKPVKGIDYLYATVNKQVYLGKKDDWLDRDLTRLKAKLKGITADADVEKVVNDFIGGLNEKEKR